MTSQLLLLTLAGLVAGVVNTLAGGGSLLSLPALVLVGLPADVANATNRVGVLVQSLSATARFARAGRLRPREDARVLAVTTLGGGLGALASLAFDASELRWLMGLALLLLAPLALVDPGAWLREPSPPRPPRPRDLLLLGLIGAYGGFLQAGVGVFLLGALVLAMGRDAVTANVTKVLAVLLLTLVAALLYTRAQLISLPHGLALAAGSSVGGWLGGSLSLRGGARLIRVALLLAIVASGARLLAGP